MDRETLENLKNNAEKRCTDLYNQAIEINTELERSRGDYRTYDSLLSNWQDSPPDLTEGEVLVNGEVMDAFPTASKKLKKEKV